MYLSPHQLHHVSNLAFSKVLRETGSLFLIRLAGIFALCQYFLIHFVQPLPSPPFLVSILKGQALSESKCELRNTQFARLCIGRQSTVFWAFLKKSFILLYESTFKLLLVWFTWNFFLHSCPLIYHRALGKVIPDK